MKLLKRYIITIVLVSLSFAWQACESLLDDQVPVSVLTFGNAYETQGDLDAGLQAVYNRLLFALGEANGNYYNTGLLGDETAPRIADWGDLRAGSTYWGFAPFTGSVAAFDGTFTPTDGLANWQAFYVPINMINTLLEVSEGIDFSSEAAREVYNGELYFLRALSYFHLLRLWGRVPVIDFAYTSANQDFFPDQSEPAEVANFIAEDINRANSLLAEAPFSRVRATTGAVNALKAHFYAWKGRVLDGGDSDLQTAAEAAQQVISSGSYQLLDNYADIFYTGYQSQEAIFELLTRPGLFTTNLFAWAKDPIRPDRPRGLIEFSDADLEYFANTPEDERIEVLRNESQPGDLVQAPYVSKWLGKSSGSSPSDEADNIILFRLADMILLRAEMLNELGNTSEAIDLLNQVRNRAGLPDTTASTQAEVSEAIFNERRYELLAEGHLWYDLVRFGKAIDLPEIDSPDEIYLPVFQAELDANPNLVQNPFYQ